jgi:cytochrome c1
MKISLILRRAGAMLIFKCPGCQGNHGVRIRALSSPGDSNGPGWEWNGDAERPTFSPSVLIRSYRYPHPFEPDANPEHAEIRNAFKRPENDGHEWMMSHPKWGTVCHSFVRDGQIEFLADCTHGLAGQTAPLLPWPDEEPV